MTGSADIVRAAQAGSADAWSELVERFQDVAVATALGWSGDLAIAQDVAQDAFDLAFRHLGELDDAAAFPAWFRRLVRTALSRRHRRREVETAPLMGDVADGGTDPAAIALGRIEAARVRTAIEALPEPERMVIALHYLAGLSHPEVAAFLGIGVSAAKKRAHVARRRLKEVLPMAADFLAASRPSRFREPIVLWRALRRGDRSTVARLLEQHPELVDAEEDWTMDEALAAGLPSAAHATPLVRAAGAGDVAMVRLLVGAGADVNRTCGCAGGESALWAATAVGATGVMAFLLAAGADPNSAAFRGATPLHVAAQRGDGESFHLLIARGADPGRLDGSGRTPASWLPASPDAGETHSTSQGLLATGIRVLDLFVPLARGSVQRWPAAPGLGQLVVVNELARSMAPATCWWIGFEQGLVDREQIRHASAEMGVSGRISLIDRDGDPARGRESFRATVDALLADRGDPKLVICFESTGHAHDVAAVLPELRGAPDVLVTLVMEEFIGTWPVPRPLPPEGYDGQVCFDVGRGARGLYPAIDPATTVARRYPSERHQRIAAGARAFLAEYEQQDPELSLAAPGPAADLVRYLAQPFSGAEAFTSTTGERTPYEALLTRVEEILGESPSRD